MTDLTGHELGRYHILEKLGEGGMAIVYKAYDTHLETDVAVKVIRTENLPQSGVERALKRFEREAKALGRLTHQNIVKVTDYGEHEGQPFLVMPYLPGGTLKTKLGKPIPFQEAAQLILPIAEALRYAHSQNMIHRDVKPANILLTQSGHPMLTDFGIAKLLDLEETSELTGTNTAMGTPEYMAPEQMTAKTVDHRADIYALGIVLYEMLTGRKPFVADTPMAVLIMHARDPLPSPRKFVPDLSERAEKILLKALAKQPEDRYQSMDEFLAALTIQPVAPSKSVPEAPRLGKEQIATIIEAPARETAISFSRTRPRPGLLWLALGIAVLGVALLCGLISWALGGGASNLFPTRTPTMTLTPSATLTPTFTSTPVLGVGSTWISPKDDMTMLYIPAGEFSMGSNDWDSLKPVHIVYLDAYWMDQTEVTNDMFAKFVDETGYITDAEKAGESLFCISAGCAPGKGVNWNHPFWPDSSLSGPGNHPVVHVSWNDASAYCEWRGDGTRLPTEAEWEKAASWDNDRQEKRVYPWGNTFNGSLLNFCDKNCRSPWSDKNVDDGYEFSAPVGSYPGGVSFYGVLDMAGNVSEWVMDYFDASYYSYSPSSNPQGPSVRSTRVVRDGDWGDPGNMAFSILRAGSYPTDTSNNKGFRCARSQ